MATEEQNKKPIQKRLNPISGNNKGTEDDPKKRPRLSIYWIYAIIFAIIIGYNFYRGSSSSGFEIENTRLTEMPDIKWITNAATPDYTDIRDDRILMFTSATGQPKNYYYMVRAVSPGEYQLGPVQADAMYNGAYHSYNGAGVVTISEK